MLKLKKWLSEISLERKILTAYYFYHDLHGKQNCQCGICFSL